MNTFRLLLLGFLFFGWACSGTKQVAVQENPIQKEPVYSLVYIIHGDSDYLYHKNGNAYQADEQALKEAFDVASNAESGEVFIFHQKPEKRAFLFFPKKDRRFYHYRNGKLVQQIDYSPETGGLEAEFELINRYTSSNTQRMGLFYFGHEIPVSEHIIYHQSNPDQIFDIDIFTRNLDMLPSKLDIIALSTCNNGTPTVAQSLINHSETLVASPQNLHLSYLNTSKILLLEENPSISSLALGDSIAKSSFSELRSFVETEITVSVYDMNQISGYVNDLASSYTDTLKFSERFSPNGDNLDCKDVLALSSEIKAGGVITYYNPALFGKNSAKTSHSGWGCKP